jgi:excisionase family DNA binding protein
MAMELLSFKEGAKFLGLSPYTLRLWSYQGRFPTVRLGRRVLLKKEDLEALVERNTRPAANRESGEKKVPIEQ